MDNAVICTQMEDSVGIEFTHRDNVIFLAEMPLNIEEGMNKVTPLIVSLSCLLIVRILAGVPMTQPSQATQARWYDHKQKQSITG